MPIYINQNKCRKKGILEFTSLMMNSNFVVSLLSHSKNIRAKFRFALLSLFFYKNLSQLHIIYK